MYKAYRWNAKEKTLHTQNEPNGPWEIASEKQAIEYLAFNLVQLEKTVVEQEQTIEKLKHEIKIWTSD